MGKMLEKKNSARQVITVDVQQEDRNVFDCQGAVALLKLEKLKTQPRHIMPSLVYGDEQ